MDPSLPPNQSLVLDSSTNRNKRYGILRSARPAPVKHDPRRSKDARPSRGVDAQVLHECLLRTSQSACRGRHLGCRGVGGELAGLSAKPPYQVKRTLIAGDQFIAYLHVSAENT